MQYRANCIFVTDIGFYQSSRRFETIYIILMRELGVLSYFGDTVYHLSFLKYIRVRAANGRRRLHLMVFSVRLHSQNLLW